MSQNTGHLFNSSNPSSPCPSPTDSQSAPESRPNTATNARGSLTEREKNMRKYYKDDTKKEKLKVRIDKYKSEVQYLLLKIEDLEKYIR